MATLQKHNKNAKCAGEKHLDFFSIWMFFTEAEKNHSQGFGMNSDHTMVKEIILF